MAAQACPILHLSKCQIVGNLMPRLLYYSGFKDRCESLETSTGGITLILGVQVVSVYSYFEPTTDYCIMCMIVKSHALPNVPVYKKNRIALLLCIFETSLVLNGDCVYNQANTINAIFMQTAAYLKLHNL